MTQMLGLSEREFKMTMINVLQAFVERWIAYTNIW